MIRFGQIKIGQDFTRKGYPKVWRRIQGCFALPVNQIGMGHAGWHIDVSEMVILVERKNLYNE